MYQRHTTSYYYKRLFKYAHRTPCATGQPPRYDVSLVNASKNRREFERRKSQLISMSYYSGSPSRTTISTKKDYHVVFKSSGSKPLERCQSGGSVTRVYDKSSKGYVLALSGGRSTSVRFPKKRAASLGLTSARPYLILRICRLGGLLLVKSLFQTQVNKAQAIFSTAFKEELYGELHAQIFCRIWRGENG